MAFVTHNTLAKNLGFLGGKDISNINVLNKKIESITKICLSSEDQYLITGCSDGSLAVWNFQERKCLMRSSNCHTGKSSKQFERQMPFMQ